LLSPVLRAAAKVQLSPQTVTQKTNKQQTEQIKVMAKNNTNTSPLTTAQIREQLKLLNAQLAEASQLELQPKKDDVTKRFTELVALVKEVRELDVLYVSPFTVRVDRQELTNDNVVSFLGTDGKNIGEIIQTFKGGGKKVKAWIETMLSATPKLLVKAEQPKANGRGNLTIYKKK
jgi:hypothetical protein